MAEKINSLVWSGFLLALLLGTGLMLSIRLRFFQLLKFPAVFKRTFLSLFREKDSGGEVTRLQSVSSALAATMGTGNIVGVAAALTAGGAGAVFWMWVSALLGMALVYAENYLGALYAKKGSAGAPAYLECGTGKKYLAVFFCISCSLASLGMGNMVQVNSIAQSAADSFGIPDIWTGIVCALLAFVIISGGIRRIGSVSRILIPLLSAVYLLAALAVIIKYRNELPDTFRSIFRGAFGIRAMGGGISAQMLRQSINIGLRRGVFSNEAGLGSSSLLNSSAGSSSPEKQGLWAVAEVFADTIVCCTLTALAVLASGSIGSGKNGAPLIAETFGSVMGAAAPVFTSVSILLFAFATLISWYWCGECCVKYLLSQRAVPYFRVIFAAFAAAGAYSSLESVWTISDIFNGLMAFPNLAGLIILRKKVKRPRL